MVCRLGAPFECTLQSFPEFSPDEWTCDPALYFNNDGCHCDCGAYGTAYNTTLDTP
jgi:hypothetical protein